MWIMLTCKLPVSPAPPKLSIFWAQPWPGEIGTKMRRLAILDAFRAQKGETGRRGRGSDDRLWAECLKAIEDGTFAVPAVEEKRTGHSDAEIIFGGEPNWAGAVAILYLGSKIRAFPHEFSRLSDDRLRDYVAESHELVVGDAVETQPLAAELELSPEKQSLVDAALLEGASEAEARLMACGLYDPQEGSEIKPAGWYRCRKEYAECYCTEREMAET